MKAQWKEAYAPCSFAKTFGKHKTWKLSMERLAHDSIIDLQGSRNNQKYLNWKSFQRLQKKADFWRLLRVPRYPTATNVNFPGQVNSSQLRQQPRAICVGLKPNIQQTALFETFDPALQLRGKPLTFSHWVQQWRTQRENPPTQGPGISQETTQIVNMIWDLVNDPWMVTEMSVKSSTHASQSIFIPYKQYWSSRWYFPSL